jgi:glycosyltransferase involved in cell wall biosynthesis
MMLASLPMSAEASIPATEALHVLTLTPFYPNSENDALGCFVAEPLPWIEQLGVVNSVIAVRPFYYGRVRPSQAAVPARWSHFVSLPGNFGLSSSGAFLFASILPRVRRLHRLNPVHVVHSHSALPCGHAAALLSRELHIPFVVTVHGLDAYSTYQMRGRVREWRKRVSQMVYRSASRVICVSNKVQEQVLQGLTLPANTTVVYNGVDPQIFAPADGGDNSFGTILSVGGFTPVKGQDSLLRAFAAIHRRFPNISCELIGEGPERSRVGALAVDLAIADKVQLRGHQTRSQVAEAMRRCTLFALPSRYEGLGCVYLEAMSTEKAVIACWGQGIEEVVQHAENGWLVDPDDLSGLSNALSELLANPGLRRRIGAAARQTILQNFTLAHQAARLVQLYRECRA